MTVIVGLVDKGEIWMSGDGAGVAGLHISARSDEKVFHNGPFLIGITSSFRMGNILRYRLAAPKQLVDQTDHQYLSTDFIDALRKTFEVHGFGSFRSGNGDHGGTFLLGYNKNLYLVDSDFQVGIPACGYSSVGCGSDLALGALHATVGRKPEERVMMALEAANTFSAGVSPPYTVLHQPVVKSSKPVNLVKSKKK